MKNYAKLQLARYNTFFIYLFLKKQEQQNIKLLVMGNNEKKNIDIS